MNIGKLEIILLIVLVLVILFVGAKKLPELARSVGQSAKELKRGFKDDEPSSTNESKTDATSDKK